jgi:hypothetical protein
VIWGDEEGMRDEGWVVVKLWLLEGNLSTWEVVQGASETMASNSSCGLPGGLAIISSLSLSLHSFCVLVLLSVLLHHLSFLSEFLGNDIYFSDGIL